MLEFIKSNLDLIILFATLIVSIIGFISSWAVNVFTTRKSIQEIENFRALSIELISSQSSISTTLEHLSKDIEELKEAYKK
jgi:hypothetical protein